MKKKGLSPKRRFAIIALVAVIIASVFYYVTNGRPSADIATESSLLGSSDASAFSFETTSTSASPTPSAGTIIRPIANGCDKKALDIVFFVVNAKKKEATTDTDADLNRKTATKDFVNKMTGSNLGLVSAGLGDRMSVVVSEAADASIPENPYGASHEVIQGFTTNTELINNAIGNIITTTETADLKTEIEHLTAALENDNNVADALNKNDNAERIVVILSDLNLTNTQEAVQWIRDHRFERTTNPSVLTFKNHIRYFPVNLSNTPRGSMTAVQVKANDILQAWGQRDEASDIPGKYTLTLGGRYRNLSTKDASTTLEDWLKQILGFTGTPYSTNSSNIKTEINQMYGACAVYTVTPSRSLQGLQHNQTASINFSVQNKSRDAIKDPKIQINLPHWGGRKALVIDPLQNGDRVENTTVTLGTTGVTINPNDTRVFTRTVRATKRGER